MARRRSPGREVALYPVDALGYPDGLGTGPGVVQRGRGEVDRRDPPSVCGEPERFGSVSASRVQGKAGSQLAGRGDQVRVRWAFRDHVRVFTQGLCPALFPGVLVERLGFAFAGERSGAGGF